MAFEFVNTYQAVKEWWRGPATFYVISLAIGTYYLKTITFCCCHVSKFFYRYIFFIFIVAVSFIVAAVFGDFYLYSISDPTIQVRVINSSRNDINLESYTGVVSLQYSVYIFVVGKSIHDEL